MTSLYRWLWYLLPGNPLIVRIVQGGSRRTRHLLVRMGYLGALILLVVIGLLQGTGGGGTLTLTDLAKAGTLIFAIVAYAQVALICLLAPLFMAGAIASEQSSETFDILLTTPLSNLQIVLGVLGGRLFFVLALLASGLPLFAVLLVFGGVPIASVFAAFAVAALTALVVGSVAVTLAVLRKGGRKAVYVFIIVVAGYLVGCYAADRVVRFARAHLPAHAASTTVLAAPKAIRTPSSPFGATSALLRAPLQPQNLTTTNTTPLRTHTGQTTWLTPLHPLLVLESALSSDYRPPSPADLANRNALVRFYLCRPLATFAILCLLVSGALVLLCALRLRAVGQGAGPVMLRVRRWLRLAPPGGERRRPPRSVWTNPVAWREAHARGNRVGGILARWGFAGLALFAAVGLILLYHFRALPRITDASGQIMPPDQVFRRALLTLLMIELVVVVLVAIYMSAGSVSREREDGTLDLMLATPITPRQYIWGKLRGLVSFLSLMLALPVLTLALVAGYTILGRYMQWPQAMPMYAVSSQQGSVAGPLMLPEAFAELALVLVPFVALCVAVGMSWSVKARGVLGAVIPAIGILGTLVLVISVCGIGSSLGAAPIIGPMVNAFSPVSSLVMLVDPWHTLDTLAAANTANRLSVFVAALIAGAVYSLIVWAILTGLIRNFDQTVRRLSGTA